MRDKYLEIPEVIGLYRFTGKHGNVLYVGKSINLRRRVASYFSESYKKKGYLRRMIPEITDIQWRECPHELIALLEEEDEIKRFNPRFNSELRKVGKYVYIGKTSEDIPSFFLSNDKPDDVFYGPFFRRFLGEKVFELCTDIMGLRTCRKMQEGCIRGQMGNCRMPCVKGDTSSYSYNVKIISDFLSGVDPTFLRKVDEFMAALAEDGKFERAAYVRDNRRYLRYYFKRAAFIRNFSENPCIFITNDGYSILMSGGRVLLSDEKPLKRKVALARLPDFDLSLKLSAERLHDRGNILYAWMRKRGGEFILI